MLISGGGKEYIPASQTFWFVDELTIGVEFDSGKAENFQNYTFKKKIYF